LCKLTGLMVTHGLVPVRALRRRQRGHLDIDTTVTPVFGAEMQGAVARPNPHYLGRPSYHPIVARIAETDSGVHAALRTGDTGLGLLYVRIDAAGDCSAILRTIPAFIDCHVAAAAPLRPMRNRR